MRLNFRKGISAVVVSIVVVGTSLAGDAVESGLKPGQYVTPFQVDDITGPNKGTSLCYRCLYGASPVVCVFARKTSEPLAGLVKKIDAKIGENDKLKSFVVVIPKKGEMPAEQLRKLARDAGIKHVPLTIAESPDGPPDYDVDRDADFTVLMWNTHTVKFNHAFQGELTDKDIRAILADIPKLLGE